MLVLLLNFGQVINFTGIKLPKWKATTTSTLLYFLSDGHSIFLHSFLIQLHSYFTLSLEVIENQAVFVLSGFQIRWVVEIGYRDNRYTKKNWVQWQRGQEMKAEEHWVWGSWCVCSEKKSSWRTSYLKGALKSEWLGWKWWRKLHMWESCNQRKRNHLGGLEYTGWMREVAANRQKRSIEGFPMEGLQYQVNL